MFPKGIVYSFFLIMWWWQVPLTHRRPLAFLNLGSSVP